MCVSGRETAERTGHGQRGRPVRVALRCDRTCRNRGVVECGWEVGCSPYLPSILDRSGSTLHRPHRSIHGPIAAHEQEQTQTKAQADTERGREGPIVRALAARATPHAGLTPRFGPSGLRLASADLLHAALTRRKGAKHHTRGLGGSRAAVTRAAVCRTAVFVSSSSNVPTFERVRRSGWASVSTRETVSNHLVRGLRTREPPSRVRLMFDL